MGTGRQRHDRVGGALMTAIRLLIADDHPIMRDGLRGTN
jgi:hypothetical protein